MNLILWGGLAALLLLGLMLVMAERKARAANERAVRAERKASAEPPEVLTKEEVAAWRMKATRIRTAEIDAAKKANGLWKAGEKKRSNEWKKQHERESRDGDKKK